MYSVFFFARFQGEIVFETQESSDDLSNLIKKIENAHNEISPNIKIFSSMEKQSVKITGNKIVIDSVDGAQYLCDICFDDGGCQQPCSDYGFRHRKVDQIEITMYKDGEPFDMEKNLFIFCE